MAKIHFSLTIALVLLFAGCSTAMDSNSNAANYAASSDSQTMTREMAVPAEDAGGGGGGGEDEVGSATRETADTGSPIKRKIIRNADLSLESPKPAEAQQKITSIAEAKSGFVVSSKKSSEGELLRDRESVEMTVRVPAEVFDDVLTEIRKTASRVVVEEVTGKDVTEEFVDLEARLKNKKALEEQFLEIMKRANTVEDALKVQRDVSEVRGEIEQIQGRMRFLQNQSALSTIAIKIVLPAEVTANSKGFFSELRKVFSDSIESALGFLLGFFRVVLAIIPFLLLVVLPLVVILRYLLKKYGKGGIAESLGFERPSSRPKDEE